MGVKTFTFCYLDTEKSNFCNFDEASKCTKPQRIYNSHYGNGAPAMSEGLRLTRILGLGKNRVTQNSY